MILWLLELSATDMSARLRIIGLTMLAAMFVLTALFAVANQAGRHE
jgi:hypothetical protein